MPEKLLVFNLSHGPNTSDLSEESNSWYLKNYESFFGEVSHLSLVSPKRETVTKGNSSFYFRCGSNGILNLLLSPIRLYRFVKSTRPDIMITYEQVWLWWTIILVRLFTKIPVYLIPLTFPEQMYKITKKGIAGTLPIWLERIFLNLSYRSCTGVISSHNVGNHINWMKSNFIISKKLLIGNSLPESVVFPGFYKNIKEIKERYEDIDPDRDTVRLIYVGRLHSEKMTDHLIKAMAIIKSEIPHVTLKIIGKGPDRKLLSEMAENLKISDIIKFEDYVPNALLPFHLAESHIFMAPSTGHAFREASICGLPVVAYNFDWIQGFLTHEENFFGIDEMDYHALAEGVITICKDNKLRHRISKNIKEFAFKYWSPERVQDSLIDIFKKN